ncbi:MAG TPA: hypothetical protein VFY35_02440 [Burkholderiaceae bacterium]|nr:hypothetical protein [Burkholderiaceae bacterium]
MSTPLPRPPWPARRWLPIVLLLACPLVTLAHPRPSAVVPPAPDVRPPEGQDWPWGTGFEQRQQQQPPVAPSPTHTPPPGGRAGTGQAGSGQAGKGRAR